MFSLTNHSGARTALRLLISGSLAAAFLMFAGDASTQDKNIKKVPIGQTDASSGKEMFASYCAACHGADGKGNGPAASSFKVPPADLTMLVKNNHGEFPSDHVWAILHFGTKAAAHGSSEMPVWGDVLSGLEPTDTIKQEQRIANLVSYLKTLQAK
jgi:mono/diheme cytochrome c family protein